MELKLKLDYEQVLHLVHQLPKDKIAQLSKTLNEEVSAQHQVDKKSLRQLIESAPTWSDKQFNEYEQARDHFNNSRLI